DALRDVPLTFVSVTYGAGGSTRELTRDLVVDINESTPYPAMAHLTCIGHTKPELVSLLDDYYAAGVHNILALAGDPPADGSDAPGDFTYALELVDLIRSRSDDFTVAVAAHPELHPRSTNRDEDRRHLAHKLAMADFAVTQFFFDPADYFRMVEEVAALTPGGGAKPIVPGIMPLSNPEGVRRMAAMSGASFPTELAERIEAASEEDRPKIVVDAAVSFCRELLDGGAPGLHIYGLNRSETVLGILEGLS
ncbi:MAG TPA: methylenetetrahydrofolate reductase, partial [Microthrixaceae bacterium]|nr:methylenetetrahydrofolate reductase [Microthrixaceae bacterium]